MTYAVRQLPGNRRRRLAAITVAGLLVAAAAGFGISKLLQAKDQPTSLGPNAVQPGITALGVNPFGAGGQLVPLQQFIADKASTGYTVPFPASPLANSENVGSIWENTFTGGAVVYFPSSGIELLYGGTGADYTGIPASQIQTINGVRAIVFPAGTASNFAQVLLPIPGGHLVTLLSDGPLSDLVSVAKTMPITGSE